MGCNQNAERLGRGSRASAMLATSSWPTGEGGRGGAGSAGGRTRAAAAEPADLEALLPAVRREVRARNSRLRLEVLKKHLSPPPHTRSPLASPLTRAAALPRSRV